MDRESNKVRSLTPLSLYVLSTVLTTHLVVGSVLRFLLSTAVVFDCLLLFSEFACRRRDGAAHAKEARKKVQVKEKENVVNNKYSQLSNKKLKSK